MLNIIPFSLVLLLSAAQFFSDRLNIERSKYREHIISFAAAIAITYLLLSFLPEAYKNSEGISLFVPLISGFVLIHLVEKFFYRKYSARFYLRRAKTFHDELHTMILFIYHFVIGAVLIRLLDTDLVSGIFLMPPLLLFTTIGNWSLHHIYLQQIPHRRLLLASSTILGALFAKSAFFTPLIGTIMFNFAAGILLFIVVRESIPQPKEGKPMIFLLGVVIYAVMIFLLNQVA